MPRPLPAVAFFLAPILLSSGCGQHEVLVQEGTGHVVLTPLAQVPASPLHHQMVYVPVYSSIYFGFDRQLTDLAATLSIRNVSPRFSIVIHSVAYYDSNGKLVRQYVQQPGSLGPLATADYVIQRHDESGGTGANFLVEWSATDNVDEPVIEAVMIGQHGNAGISFTGMGRPLPNASSDLRSTQ